MFHVVVKKVYCLLTVTKYSCTKFYVLVLSYMCVYMYTYCLVYLTCVITVASFPESLVYSVVLTFMFAHAKKYYVISEMHMHGNVYVYLFQ